MAEQYEHDREIQESHAHDIRLKIDHNHNDNISPVRKPQDIKDLRTSTNSQKFFNNKAQYNQDRSVSELLLES